MRWRKGFSISKAANTNDLRSCLRGATAAAHDQLDRTMREVSGWSSEAEYRQFLSLQYAARAPIEGWLSEEAPDDLKPPPQCPLIARDLMALDAPVPKIPARVSASFSAPPADRAGIMGVAWVVAGSALGNRSILKELDHAGQSQWPSSFLGDPHMLSFWSRLKRQMREPASDADVETATQGAFTAFNHFTAHARETGVRASDLRTHERSCPMSVP
ncbi:biliverdin-producing heme oxygenase [Erythrobacter ani]|uniref:Biliverdin-producing heme oxygenase n=1 Tax=Erythrobacter ani TaxID=2827235 RepID=A0ABS6SJB3_9SPHN|nr:biliverdin-producing heme oxygenase [Erythrobacter ani]MBV7265098.1 biliverdin-producing heme oxygenase [Erythrobacter ani]